MRCAVIGDPVAHSLSPAIHRAGYGALGLDWSYEAIRVAPNELDGFVAGCAAGDWAGLSVTAPHKSAIMALGEPDEMAKLVGVGNTVVFAETIQIYNTDVFGFVRAWQAHSLPKPKRVAIVGNGATARSILVALTGLDAGEVMVLARNPQRAATLVDLGTALGVTTTALPLDASLDNLDLVANTVPGTATEPHARCWAAAARTVFDVVYDPWPTPLGRAAHEIGRVALSGLDLLAGQAVHQFELLTSKSLTFEFCRRAAAKSLGDL